MHFSNNDSNYFVMLRNALELFYDLGISQVIKNAIKKLNNSNCYRTLNNFDRKRNQTPFNLEL